MKVVVGVLPGTGAQIRTRLATAVAALAAVAVLAGGYPLALRDASLPRLSPAPASSPRAVVDPALRRIPAGDARAIVQADPARLADAVAAVEGAGGRVKLALPIIEGFGAEIPVTAIDEVAESDAIRVLTADRRVRFEEMSYDDTTTASNFTRTSGATAAWATGRYGAGVGVAVIDTGVSSMNDFAGRVVFGPDLSGEGRTIDSYGHGTVMAGIIGGSGADSAGNASGAYTGVAPLATLVSVKAAGRNGATDVSTMLQAMHWVSAYRAEFNIRVLNLSWGTPSTQDPAVDPLNYAVERLWRDGIVVVVAAGNSGPKAGTITKPGDDPVVLTVGGFNDRANTVLTDDDIPSWSSRGPTAHGRAKPDVVAPGRTLVSARSYGSLVEYENPRALISPSYIKGSGTSQAAAVTSGVVALLLEARPGLTPDEVKAILRSTASPISGIGVNDQGTGRIDLAAALSAQVPAGAAQTFASTGLGSLESSRGGRNVEADCGNDGTVDVIKGEIDVRCEAWNGAAWTGAAWTGAAWTGAAWTGAAWTGAAWTGAAWTGAAWTGAAWTGGAWTTGVYGDEEDIFLTAFYGECPPAVLKIPGEIACEVLAARLQRVRS